MKSGNGIIAYVIAIAFFFYFSPHLQGQKKNFLAIDYGYGNQDWLNVEYCYQAHLFGLNYSKHFAASGPLHWSVLVNPHFVRGSFICNVTSDEFEQAYEVGLGLGFLGNFRLINDQYYVWFSAQTGPHYISDAPDRQIPGFIFSNQFKAGVDFNLDNNWSLGLFLGFRHLSNAETRLPNGGINNLIRGLQVKLAM